MESSQGIQVTSTSKNVPCWQPVRKGKSQCYDLKELHSAKNLNKLGSTILTTETPHNSLAQSTLFQSHRALKKGPKLSYTVPGLLTRGTVRKQLGVDLSHSVWWWIRHGRHCLQCRGHWFNPWVEKIIWRREQLPIPVFLPGEFYRQRSLVGTVHGVAESDMIEQLTLALCLWQQQKNQYIMSQNLEVRRVNMIT